MLQRAVSGIYIRLHVLPQRDAFLGLYLSVRGRDPVRPLDPAIALRGPPLVVPLVRVGLRTRHVHSVLLFRMSVLQACCTPTRLLCEENPLASELQDMGDDFLFFHPLALPAHAARRATARPCPRYESASACMGPLRPAEQGPFSSSSGGGSRGGYYASPALFASWSRSSSKQGTPLLTGQYSRGLTIRTPRQDAQWRGADRGALAGVIDLFRLGGRSRRTVASLAVAVALLLYFITGAPLWRDDGGVRAFVRAGGFGLDYMGRTEDESGLAVLAAERTEAGSDQLPPVPVEGGLSKLCALFPWRKDCAEELRRNRDPFEGLVFPEKRGHLFYPAVAAPEPPPSFDRPGRRAPPPVDVDSQPHPIHYLIREGKKAWKAKVARQSKTLHEAVAEYERRYWRRPPKGFDQWFEFAKENDFVMVDEFDAMMEKVLPFLAVKPSTLAKRHDMIQFDKDFWIQVRRRSCLVRRGATAS